MLRNEQQPMLELNLGEPLYHVTCVVASVHLHLDSDPIYGCTDEPPTLVLGWTLSFTIVDHIYIYTFALSILSITNLLVLISHLLPLQGSLHEQENDFSSISRKQ